MKRDTRAAYRARAAAMDRTIDEAVAAVRAERDAEFAAARERARAAESARPKYTRAELAGVRVVRNRTGWHKVIRVNTTTVTVETPYSWTDRIPFNKILDAK